MVLALIPFSARKRAPPRTQCLKHDLGGRAQNAVTRVITIITYFVHCVFSFLRAQNIVVQTVFSELCEAFGESVPLFLQTGNQKPGYLRYIYLGH